VTQLNLRLIVFIIFLLNFIGVLIGVASIPSSVGQAMSLGEITFNKFSCNIFCLSSFELLGMARWRETLERKN
jgi:hypothetical protein